MTTGSYFIFLACLLFLNIVALYGYFLSSKASFFETVYEAPTSFSLKQAYLIQALSLLVGFIALFCFSSEKEWFFKSDFLYFLGLTVLFGIIGLIPEKLKALIVLNSLLELAGITGFVFLLPESASFIRTDFPAFVNQLLIGMAWFVIYKFFCILANRFEGIIVIQSLHIGFASLLFYAFLPATLIPLFQVNGLLLPLMLMLAPFYCIFQCELPLNRILRNFFCLLLTGLIFFTIPLGFWGISLLMGSYIFFELIVVIFHFLTNLGQKEKRPLFFFENLKEKSNLKRDVVRVVMHYNFLMDGLVFFIVYLNLQIQFVVLAILLYLKMYMNIMNPISINSGLFELLKGAKKTAQIGISGTSQAVSDLKEIYSKKSAAKKEKAEEKESEKEPEKEPEKGKDADEQP
ncbi:MAG: hypothetical protein J5716_09720 [Alphaproteobacteria bacterium]|nr:hypothetical protein [Alphaproteobacteria bacterium]